MRKLAVICTLGALGALLALVVVSQVPTRKMERRTVKLTKVSRLAQLRGTQARNLIGKEVQVQGYYYDGSIPMILDDIKLVEMDKIIPESRYVPIAGPKPRGLKSGDRVSLTVKLEKPAGGDPVYLRKESSVLRFTSSTPVKKLQATRLRLPTVQRHVIKVIGRVRVIPRYHAVLIAGGWDAANNHVRYWNDLKTMYAILRNKGYAASNIHVLYAGGTARDASMPVHYAATSANINTVFNQLKTRVKANDTLYIMLNDHGSSNALCLWNHTTMSNTGFAAQVNKITNHDKMVIQMKQCYSGGFTQPLTRTRRSVMASCSPSQVSWAHSSLQFGEFTYWYFAALTGTKPDGSGSVNADANHNGKVSITEAYNFARAHDTRPETPHFEDNGASPWHSGAMPSGGDGVRSSSIYLP